MDGVQELARPGRVDSVLHRDEDRASAAFQVGHHGHLGPVPEGLEVGPLAAGEAEPGPAGSPASNHAAEAVRATGPPRGPRRSPKHAPGRHPPEEDEQVDGQRRGLTQRGADAWAAAFKRVRAVSQDIPAGTSTMHQSTW